MRNFYKILLLGLMLVVTFSVSAQNPIFRLGVSSGWFKNELGAEDVNHPLLDLFLPAGSNADFKPDINFGYEAEVLIPLSEKSFIGVEFENARLSGSNYDSTLYNFLITPYNPIDTFVLAPYAFKTNLLNILATYKYNFNPGEKLAPFLKLTSGVSFVGTDFTFKNDDTALGFETNTLYSRGTSNSDNSKKPALIVGAGIGFDYRISEKISMQIEGLANLINSDIVNGIPNFTYENTDGNELLKRRERQSLTFQLSASLSYSLDSGWKQGARMGKAAGKSKGRTDSHLPFYRRK